MNFLSLSKNLKEGRLPAYCIYGEDEYLCAAALAQIVGLVAFCPELNVSFLAAPQSAREIAEAASQLPIGELRVTVVKEYGGKDFDAVNKYLESPDPSNVLVFYYPGGEYPPKLKGAEPVDCRKLDGGTLARWIAAKLDVSQDGAYLLAELCSQNMSRINAEAEKLKSYKPGEKLTAAEVAELVAPDAEYRIYKLADAAAKGDGTKAFSLADAFIAEKMAPVALISAVCTHFRRLLYVSINGAGEETARALGVKPYALEMSARQARSFTQRSLKKILDTLHAAELGVKSGKIDDCGALNLAVAEIVNLSRR